MAESNIWGNIFNAVLGGISSSSQRRAQRDDTREGAEAAGKENRRTAAFESALEYAYSQRNKDERRRALDGGYNQFSTIRGYAPNYVGPPALDVPELPKPENY